MTNTGQVPVEYIYAFLIYSSHTTFVSASPQANVVGQSINWPSYQRLAPGAALTYRATVKMRMDILTDTPVESQALVSALGVDQIKIDHTLIVHPVPDLTISDAQVIQVVSPGSTQGVDSPIPMIEGKHTAVRVTVGTHSLSSVPDVTGQLCYEDPARGAWGCTTPDNGPFLAPSSPDLADNDDTLNFFLPTNYLHGEVRWWVELNSDHRVRERDYTNNRWPQNPNEKKVIHFQAARPYRIAYMPIGWAPTSANPLTYPSDDIANYDDLLTRLYPLDPTTTEYDQLSAGVMYGDDWDALMAALNAQWDYLRIHDPEGAPDQLFAWLPDSICGYGGISDPTWAGGRAVVSFGNESIGGVVMAHEMGHNLGPYHPCEDSAWPYGGDYDIQTIGFDPYESHYGSGVGVRA